MTDDRPALRRAGAGGRGGRGAHEQPRRRPAAPVLPRLARGAEDARLRPPEPQRAGRLPLHQETPASGSSPRIDFAPEANPPRKTDNTGIPGAARGRAGLIMDLADEMIPYTPEQLIALAEQEFAWCEDEMKKASRADGIRRRLEEGAREGQGHARARPARQPAVIRDMLFEAVDYLRAKDLITVPQVASESLHMSMMSPEAQLVEPVLPRRRADHRVVPDQHDGVRRAAAEHARQQHPVLARDRASRDDPGAQPGRLRRRALRRLPRRASAAARRSSAKAGRSTGS